MKLLSLATALLAAGQALAFAPSNNVASRAVTKTNMAAAEENC